MPAIALRPSRGLSIASRMAIDDGVNSIPVFAEGLASARAKDGSKIAADTEMSREHLHFRAEPRIRYVSREFADVDPEFWRGKVK